MSKLCSAVDGRTIDPMKDPLPNEDCCGSLPAELVEWVDDNELLVCSWLRADLVNVDDGGSVWTETHRGDLQYGKWLLPADCAALEARIRHYVDPV